MTTPADIAARVQLLLEQYTGTRDLRHLTDLVGAVEDLRAAVQGLRFEHRLAFPRMTVGSV